MAMNDANVENFRLLVLLISLLLARVHERGLMISSRWSCRNRHDCGLGRLFPTCIIPSCYYKILCVSLLHYCDFRLERRCLYRWPLLVLLGVDSREKSSLSGVFHGWRRPQPSTSLQK